MESKINSQISQAIAVIKQVQAKHVRVCIWLDSSSIFKNDIKLWFENKELAMSEKMNADGEYVQPEIFGIPLFQISDNEPPKGFNTENYDLIYIFIEENVNKISVSEVKKYLDSNQE